MTVPAAAAWIGVPVADADVDPLVHAAPAPAERARDRAVHRPDQAGGRRRRGRAARPGGSPARRGCARAIASARRLQRVDLARLGLLGPRSACERSVQLLAACVATGRSVAPTSSSRTSRVCAVRAEITAVSLCTVARSFFVFARAALTCALASRNLAARCAGPARRCRSGTAPCRARPARCSQPRNTSSVDVWSDS